MQRRKHLIMNNEKKTWTLETKIDPDNPDDLILEFPPDFLEQAGWKEGDTLIWTINDDDSVFLRKKSD